MKKIFILICLLFIVGNGVAQTRSATFGLGVNAGVLYPIVQDDQSSGTTFSFKAIYSLGSILIVEPNITFEKYGTPTTDDPELVGLYDGFEGSKVTSYGVDGIIGGGSGSGLRSYLILGIGYYNVQRDIALQDETDVGYSGGVGIGLGITSAMSLDVRGKLYVIPSDGGGSKKSASATVGLNYYFTK